MSDWGDKGPDSCCVKPPCDKLNPDYRTEVDAAILNYQFGIIHMLLSL